MRILACSLVFLLALTVPGSAAAAPEGQLTYAVHISLAARWFDPAEMEGIITPFMVFYAVHDFSSRCRASRSRRAWPRAGPCRRTASRTSSPWSLLRNSSGRRVFSPGGLPTSAVRPASQA